MSRETLWSAIRRWREEGRAVDRAEPTAPTVVDSRSTAPLWLDVGLIVAIAPLAFIAARILVFAGGDFTLMRTITSNFDVVGAVLGTALPVVPFAFFTVALVWVTSIPRKAEIRTERRRRWTLLGLILLLLAAFILVAQWPYSAMSALAVVIGMPVGYLMARRRARVERSRRSRRPYLFTPRGLWTTTIAYAVGCLILLPAGLWLPKERIVVAGGGELDGYVVNIDENWATIISEADGVKGVTYLETDTIWSREACDFFGDSLLSLLLDRDRSDTFVECEL